VRRCGIVLTSAKLLQGCNLLEVQGFEVWFRRMGGCYVFSCNIPPCLLVAVTRPHPIASSFSSVCGEYQAHTPFGQYAS
jgi:hypothetical protein